MWVWHLALCKRDKYLLKLPVWFGQYLKSLHEWFPCVRNNAFRSPDLSLWIFPWKFPCSLVWCTKPTSDPGFPSSSMTDSGIYVLLASPNHKKSLSSLNRSLQSDENHFPFFFLFSLSLFFLYWSIKRPFAFLQSSFLWSWKSILQEDMGPLKLPPHPSEILFLTVDFTWLIHHNICLWNIFLK